jgi:hypothetical protein
MQETSAAVQAMVDEFVSTVWHPDSPMDDVVLLCDAAQRKDAKVAFMMSSMVEAMVEIHMKYINAQNVESAMNEYMDRQGGRKSKRRPGGIRRKRPTNRNEDNGGEGEGEGTVN